MWSMIIQGALWLLRSLLGPKPAPTVADKAAEAASAETNLQNSEAANAIATKAAAARADADTQRVLHDPNAGSVHAAANDAINQDPNLHLRD